MDIKTTKVVLVCFGSEGHPYDEGTNISKCLHEYGKEALKSGIDEFLAFTPRTLQDAIGVERAKRATKVYGEDHRVLPPYHKVGLGAWRAEILKYAVDTHSDGDVVIIHDPNYIKYPGILKHFAPNARQYALAAMEISKDSEIFSPMCMKVIHTVSRGAVLNVIDKCKDAVITNPDTIANYPSARCRSIIVKISPKTRRFVEDFSRLCADESILSPPDRSRPGGWGRNGFIHHAAEQAVFNALAYVGGYFDIVRDKWILELSNLGGESSDMNFPGDMGTYKLIKHAGLIKRR